VQHDIIILGGGINGAALAHEAASRGLKVLLLEKGDLACATSSWSTKLIHGGLRYLEHYQFKLVRHALAERHHLQLKAKHLIQPLDFLIPHTPQQRPMWMVHAGLKAYDLLAPRACGIHKSTRVALSRTTEGSALKPEFQRGFCYADCQTDDARLVVHFAKAAQALGATISTHSAATACERQSDRWQVSYQQDGRTETAHAKLLINATGPWVQQVAQNLMGTPCPDVSLVKGSHIIVPKCYEGRRAFLLQHTDKRIIFTIPYAHNTTLIGTTDVPHQGSVAQPTIDQHEIEYLLGVVNHYFSHQLSKQDIRYHYSGLRTLVSKANTDLSALSRDNFYQASHNSPTPYVHVISGKITTARHMAQQIIESCHEHFPHLKKTDTKTITPLPGGDFSGDLSDLIQQYCKQYPKLSKTLLSRAAASYGTRAAIWLGSAETFDDLGIHFGGGLTQAEVNYLCDEEWARCAEDILWRRSKFILALDSTQQQRLEEYCHDRQPLPR